VRGPCTVRLLRGGSLQCDAELLDKPEVIALNDDQLMVVAASEGLGIAYVSERLVSSELKARKLAVVLSEWCPRIPGLALYYPGHRQVPAGLRAFIDILKETRDGEAQ
jgi:DNA-binding transcriptional LysR family regulator